MNHCLRSFIFLLLLGANALTESCAQQPRNQNDAAGTRPPDIDSIDMPEENQFNTASLTTNDGKTFKLIVIGDRLPQLFIDGEKISKDDLPVYQDNIDKLHEIIVERQKKENERTNAIWERTKNQILVDLVDQKVVSARKDVRSYYLTSQYLKVNGRIQDPDTFLFLRNRYIRSADMVFYFEAESNYTFQKSSNEYR